MPTTTTIPVVGAAPGTTVELVPGKKFYDLPPAAVPPLGVAEWVPAGGGTYRFVARVLSRWHVLNSRTMRMLGIPCSHATLYRLIRANFIESRQTAPNTREFSYDSYLAHAEATKDPEFWTRREPGQRFSNLERFRQASGEIKSS